MDTLGQGDMIHPKLRKIAEEWVEDVFNPTVDEMRQIRRMPDRHFKMRVNAAWDGGWVDFVRSNTIDGEYV